MSIVKDIADLHITLRGAIISYIVVMPFWYLGMYYNGRDFFTSNPIQIPIILSFCLTTVSLIIGCLFALIDHIKRMRKLEKKDPVELSELIVVGCIYSIFIIGVYIVTSAMYHKFPLKQFIASTLLSQILVMPLGFLSFKFKKANKQK